MATRAEIKHSQDHGLYSPAHEHDACGVGFVAHIKGHKSHAIVQQGLKILENLDHRGAVGADALMGDGAGILIQLPDALYREEMAKQGVTLPPPGEYGVGMVFLPKEHASRLACEQALERAVRAEGQVLLGWRDVPVNRDMPMSPTVRLKEPILKQIFIGRGNDVIVQDALERKLYVIRKTASAAIQNLHLTHSKEYYVPSMSSRTVVYKGLLLADQAPPDRVLHAQQLAGLALEHPPGRDAGPGADDVGDVVGANLVLDHRSLAAGCGRGRLGCLRLGQILFESGDLAVHERGCALKVAITLHPLGLPAELVDLRLEISDPVEPALLLLPARVQGGELLGPVGQVAPKPLEPIPGRLVGLVLQRELLHLEPVHSALELVDLDR